MDNEKQILEQFKEAVLGIWLRDGENTWPIEINSVVHLFMDLFFAELQDDIQRLKARGLSDKEIAGRFHTAGRIFRLIMPCVQGMKALGIPIARQREQILYLLSLARHLKHGDLFNRDEKNTVFSQEQFEQTVTEAKMISTASAAGRKSSAVVHKLCGVLWNYAETIYFRAHGFCREFHGPYQFPGGDGGNDQVLIRDFNNLDAAELWPHCGQCGALPYKHTRIISIYENIGMTIDVYNNVAIAEGAGYISSLKSYSVEADGKFLSPEEIENFTVALSKIIIAITTEIQQRDWRFLAEKYAQIFWFSKKELRNEAGLDWRIPAAVKERIRTGSLNARFQGISRDHLKRMLQIAF